MAKRPIRTPPPGSTEWPIETDRPVAGRRKSVKITGGLVFFICVIVVIVGSLLLGMRTC